MMETNELKNVPGQKTESWPAPQDTQGGVCPSTTPSVPAKVQSLAQGNLIGNVPVAVSQAALKDLLVRLYAYCGRNALSGKDLAAEIALLDSTVRKDFAMLSLDEAIDAIETGIKAEAGADYADLSRRKFEALLTAYRKGALRKEIENVRKASEIRTISADENRRAGINLCCNIFSDYKNGKRSGLFFTPTFKTLKEEDLLHSDEKKKSELWERARMELLGDMQAKLSSFGTSGSERAAAKQNMHTLQNNPEKLRSMIQGRADDIEVRDYFDGLIEMGQELKDMFE